MSEDNFDIGVNETEDESQTAIKPSQSANSSQSAKVSHETEKDPQSKRKHATKHRQRKVKKKKDSS